MSLSSQELDQLEQAGKQIGDGLQQLLLVSPPSARTISGMAKWLGYHKSNCQRILQATQKAQHGLEVLCQLPGMASLEEFLQLLRHKALPDTVITTLEQQIRQWAELFALHFRSHADVKRTLAEAMAVAESAPAPDRLLLRQQHFVSSKALIGSSIDVVFACYLLTESEKNPEFLQEIALISKKNFCRSAEAPPFVQFYTHPHPAHFDRPLDITAASRIDTAQFQIGVVQPYSAPGFLAQYRSYSASNSGIVFADDGVGVPLDATFLFSNPDELVNPLSHQSRCSSTSISIKTPTKKLVMAVFLEKKIDMRSSVNVGCYSGNQKVEEGKLRPDDMWTELLPDYPDLSILHTASSQVKTVDEVPVGEMTDFMFRFAGLNKADFICYFMTIDYPIWSSTYRIYFQHSYV
jgi:hypothetical protein